MNEAAGLVVDSIQNENFKIISIRGKIYSVYPPTIKIICRAISSFRKIGLDGEYSRLSVIAEIPDNVPYIIKGLSLLIVGNAWNWRWKSRGVEKVLESATLRELREATEIAISLIGPDDFFGCAACLKSMTGTAAIQK